MKAEQIALQISAILISASILASCQDQSLNNAKLFVTDYRNKDKNKNSNKDLPVNIREYGIEAINFINNRNNYKKSTLFHSVVFSNPEKLTRFNGGLKFPPIPLFQITSSVLDCGIADAITVVCKNRRHVWMVSGHSSEEWLAKNPSQSNCLTVNEVGRDLVVSGFERVPDELRKSFSDMRFANVSSEVKFNLQDKMTVLVSPIGPLATPDPCVATISIFYSTGI